MDPIVRTEAILSIFKFTHISWDALAENSWANSGYPGCCWRE